MKRHAALGSAFLKALAIVVALVATAHAALPYLPQVGPPPLRFQTVITPPVPTAHFVTTAPSNPVVTNTPAVIRPTNFNAATTATTTNLVVVVPAMSATPLPSATPEPDKSLGESFTATVFPIASPDLLGITPQTLATYFRPVQIGTNSTALIGLFPLSFMPPLPSDKSSRAEYILK